MSVDRLARWAALGKRDAHGTPGERHGLQGCRGAECELGGRGRIVGLVDGDGADRVDVRAIEHNDRRPAAGWCGRPAPSTVEPADSGR
ncbi:hypothetical protein SDC9_199943 [bioreactor metagenome]|uniref:Uncharacterized protein n=1 Tax=bioreactor metagenome TaxID=1076179 RepID=A0A645IM03_9ZZZZ